MKARDNGPSRPRRGHNPRLRPGLALSAPAGVPWRPHRPGARPPTPWTCWPVPPAGRRPSPQVVQVLAEPGYELLGQVGTLAAELNHRAKVVELVAGVEPAAAEQHALHATTLADVLPGQHLERIGELDLAAPARRGLAQHAEHGRVADVAADDDPAARRLAGHRLFDQVGDDDHVFFRGRGHRDATVLGYLLGIDLHQRDDAAAVALAYLHHPGEQAVLGIDEVVTEQDGERLGAHVLGRAEHRVAEPARISLPDVVHVGEFARLAHERQTVRVVLGRQRFLELVGTVEVVLDGPLAPAG